MHNNKKGCSISVWEASVTRDMSPVTLLQNTINTDQNFHEQLVKCQFGTCSGCHA